VIDVTLTFPEGLSDATNMLVMDRDRPIQLLFAGRKRPEDGWPPGVYAGSAQLIRSIDGIETVIDSVDQQLTFP